MRHSCLRIPPIEDVEQALISSAADESKVNRKVEVQIKERAQADAEEDETDDGLRPSMRNMFVHGLWKSPQHAYKSVSKLCAYLMRQDKTSLTGTMAAVRFR